jgi:membrane-associated phospholipid phosphatase
VHRLWEHITDCGDAAVTLPLAALVLVFLLIARERRIALRWLLTVVGCAAVMGALKLVFGACISRLGGLDIVSPSGHTAMSTAIYGSLALLIGSALPPGRRQALLAAAAIFVLAIAVSRVVLRMHDTPEIIVGFVVGLAAAAWFRAGLRRVAAPLLPISWLVLGGLAVVVVMHGTRLDIEPQLRQVAGVFRLELPWCR